VSNIAELQLLVKARDEASDVLQKLHGGISALPQVALLATAAAGAAALKFAMDFDSAYDKIRVATGATGDELGELKDVFRDVVRDVPTDFDTASTAISELNSRLGVTGEPLRELTGQFLELSRITESDLSTNIETVTRVFGDWSVATGDQSSALDFLFNVSQSTGVGIDKIGSLVVQYGAPLRTFGFSFEEAAVMMGKFEQEGVNTELVMGSMRIALNHFAKEGLNARDGLEQTIAKIQELGPSAEATSLAVEIFGARAGPDMAAAILEGRFAIDELLTTVSASEDTIMGAARETMDWQEKLTLLKNRALVGLEPILMGVFNGVNMLVDGFIKLTANVPTPVLTAFGIAIAAIVGGLAAFAVVSAVATVAAAAFGVAIAIATSPITLIALAILGIIAAGYLLYTHWDELKAKATEVWNSIPAPVQAVLTFFTGTVVATFNSVKDTLVASFNAIKEAVALVVAIIQGDWSGAWEHLKGLASSVMDVALAPLKLAVDTVGSALTAAGVPVGTFSGALSGALASACGIAKGAIDLISSAVETLSGWLAKPYSLTMNVGGWIVGAVQNIINVVTNLWNMLQRAFTLNVSVNMPKIPDITPWASGVRNWEGGLALVGEQGPELLRLPRGVDIYSNTELRAMTNSPVSPVSGGGTTLKVEIHGNVNIGDEDPKKGLGRIGDMAWGLAQATRRRGGLP
jgi:TP901 family phage tail tape measure protein